MDQDRRHTIRHRTLKGGRIVTNDGHSTFNCTIRNLSETGALLRLVSVVGVPDTFSLLLDDGRSFACTAAHRTATDIGVHFT